MNTYIYTAQLADLMGVYGLVVQHYLGPFVIIGATVSRFGFSSKNSQGPCSS